MRRFTPRQKRLPLGSYDIFFFAWNMRGFNMSRKHEAVRSWIQVEKPSFGCLIETRVQQENHIKRMEVALPGWSSLTNYEHHRLGHIWFCWSNKVVVTKLHMSSQVITCAIQIPETRDKFICSAVYASNCMTERRQLWEELKGTRADYARLDLPWIVLGDFNATLASMKHSRAMDYLTDQTGTREFQYAVADCELADLAYVGAIFTWWNKREGNPIGKKLHRALINDVWLRFYPQSYAKFDAGGVSDHARCLVHISDKRDETRKPLKFFNYLKDHEDFLPTVKNFWDISPLLYHSRCSLSMFHRKLKLLKNDLHALNRNHYGDLPNITKQAYEHLCYCQNQVLMDPTPISLATEAEASKRWNLLASIEEKIY